MPNLTPHLQLTVRIASTDTHQICMHIATADTHQSKWYIFISKTSSPVLAGRRHI